MHKYWGKKPASGISPLIDKYTNPGDTIMDLSLDMECFVVKPF